MLRKRQRKVKKSHYALLVNRKAHGYQKREVSRLITAIRSDGGSYTLYEPDSALDMVRQAEVACGLRQATARLPRPFERGGKVTALVACGGDGTFNLVARAAWKTGLPVGIYPLGRLNNIALSFYGTVEPERAIKHVLSPKARPTDVGVAGNLPFYGSIGVGFIPGLIEELQQRTPPRMAVGWSRLGAETAAGVTREKTVIKVDAFRFEVQPLMLNINLLPYSAGLPISPASIPDDGHAEIIFDVGPDAGEFSAYTRLILKRRFLYGEGFRLYRGRHIALTPVKGRILSLDGELIELPANALEIKIEEKKLQVLH
jgi:diacylglycerol kinase family enzyme